CCAAALANLDIWEEEPVFERIARIAELQEAALVKLAADERFENPRRLGTIAAIDLKVADGGYLASAALTLRPHLSTQRILLRPLVNTIYVMPPYCTTAGDLRLVYEAIQSAPDAIG